MTASDMGNYLVKRQEGNFLSYEAILYYERNISYTGATFVKTHPIMHLILYILQNINLTLKRNHFCLSKWKNAKC